MKISGIFDVEIIRDGKPLRRIKTSNTLTKRGAIHFLTLAVGGAVPWTLGGDLEDWINVWWCVLRWIDVDNFVTLHRDDAIEYTEWPGTTHQTDNRQWEDDGNFGTLEWDDKTFNNFLDPTTTSFTMTRSWRAGGARNYKGLWLEYNRDTVSGSNYERCHAVISEAIFDPVLEIHNNDKVTVKYTLSMV